MSDNAEVQSNGSGNSQGGLSTLPKGWCWATVGEITENHDSDRFPIKADIRQKRSGSFPYYGASGIIDDIDDYLFDGEYLLIAEDGANLLSRSTPIAFRANGRFWVNNHAHVVRTNVGISLAYLESYFNGINIQFYVTGTAQPKLNQVNLNRIPCPLAPPNEQLRIVAKIEELFSDLDAGVTALKRIKANLKRYRAAVLKAAVEGRLTEAWRAEHPKVEPASKLLERILVERRKKWEADQLAKFAAADKTPPKGWREKYVEPSAPDVGGLPELPKGWCWTTLESLAQLVGGITKDKKRMNQPGMREVPYLRVANVQRGFLDLTEMKTIVGPQADIADLRLHVGDVLFTEGGDRDKLGRGWVWSGEIAECIHQNHIFRARLFCKDMQPRFVSHHGNTFGQEWFTKVGKQTTNLASINLGVLRLFPVPIPPSIEQQEIVAQLDEKLSQIEAAEVATENSLQRSARLRQSILKRAFEGKLVPQDPTDEPADKLLERIRQERTATNGNSVALRDRRDRAEKHPTPKAKRTGSA